MAKLLSVEVEISHQVPRHRVLHLMVGLNFRSEKELRNESNLESAWCVLKTINES